MIVRAESLPFCHTVPERQSHLHWRWKDLGQFLSTLWLQGVTPDLFFTLKPGHCTEKATPSTPVAYIVHLHADPEILIQVLP